MEVEKNLLNKLRSNFEYMSGVEKKIADVILDNPKRFISLSMVELAELAGVSQGSIINFANKFAGGGYPALKLKIAADMSDYDKELFSVVEETDGVKDVLRKIAKDSYTALKNTEVINNEGSLKNVADLILKAKKVEIYGVYRSAIVANDFYFQLLTLGIPAVFVGDVLTCAVSASLLEKDCLVFAVSSSGKTKDIIDAVKIAKKNEVPVVCLTSNKNSPLAKISDEILLTASSGNTLTGKANEVRLAQLTITDALCAYLRSRIDENEEKYFNMSEIIASHSIKD
ncbi:MAG: MurR/RpiR family transcriptional regulator [Ruminococcaceae bacterium]|nr:MurR/RpiR family transcriptional regulator [Oscillospiraceae bacterium]